jgi:hypothetical protein
MCDGPLALDAPCAFGADCCGADLSCGGSADAPRCITSQCDPVSGLGCVDDARCWVSGFDERERPLGVCQGRPAGLPVDAACALDPASPAGDCDAGLVCEPDLTNTPRCMQPCETDDVCGGGLCFEHRCRATCDPVEGCGEARCHLLDVQTVKEGLKAIGICVAPGAAQVNEPCVADGRGLDDCDASLLLCDPVDSVCRTVCGPAFGAQCAEDEACDWMPEINRGFCLPVDP